MDYRLRLNKGSFTRVIANLNRHFDHFLYWSVAFCGIFFFALALVFVLSWYVFRAPILASTKLSRLIFVWGCFPAAALAYKWKAHAGFTLLFEKLPT